MSDHPVISRKKLIQVALPLNARQHGHGPGEDLGRDGILPFAALNLAVLKKRNASRFSPRRRRASAAHTGGVDGGNLFHGPRSCQLPEFENLAA